MPPSSTYKRFKSDQNIVLFCMRIGKKDRVDVRKFLEDVKANRTNRSYTSLEHPQRRPNEQDPHHQPSKYRPESTDPYRPTQQTQRFSYEPPRYAPPIYAAHPHPYPMAAEYAPSQHFTASPPYQAGFYNYSQNYNSQAFPIHRQDSVRHEQQFGTETIAGYQPNRVGSKLVTAALPKQIERTGSLHQISNTVSKVKTASPEPTRIIENVQKHTPPIQEKEKEKEGGKEEEVKPVVAQVAKKRKPRKKPEGNEEPAIKQEKKERKKPVKKESKEEMPTEAVVAELQETNTISISRRFDEILAAEREKLQAKAIQESNLKQIMGILNEKLTPIFNTHFNYTTTHKLTTLQKHISQLGKVDTRDFIFQEEVASFESEMLAQIRMLAS